MKTPNKLSKSAVLILTESLRDEYNAFYLYKAAANWTRNVGFMVASKFYEQESANELTHAQKIVDFLTDWNVTVNLPDIESPQLTFENLGELISVAYTTEYNLYESYEERSLKMFESGNICTFDFLQFYRNEQTQSVAENSDKLNILSGVDHTDKFKMLLLEETLFEQ